jgi:hypothetical protein
MTAAIARDPIYRRRRFQPEIIELCVRWYLTYRLSTETSSKCWPSEVLPFLTRPFTAGSSGTYRNTSVVLVCQARGSVMEGG